jgi:hypothetical protein
MLPWLNIILLHGEMKSSKAIADTSTSNESFMKMHHWLKGLNHLNCEFMLALHDESLLGIDPHDDNLTSEQQSRIIEECRINPWYFFREVFRVLTPGGRYIPFRLDQFSMATIWSVLGGFNVFAESPRQTGRTIVTIAIATYLKTRGIIGGIKGHHSRSHATTEYKWRMKEVMDSLPDYITRVPDCGTSMSTAQRDANKLAGHKYEPTPGFEYWEDFGRHTHNGLEFKEDDRRPIGSLITTTANRTPSPERTFALRVRANYLPFYHGLYCMPDRIMLDAYIRQLSEGLLISVNPGEIGKGDQWLRSVTAGKEPQFMAADYYSDWGPE